MIKLWKPNQNFQSNQNFDCKLKFQSQVKVCCNRKRNTQRDCIKSMHGVIYTIKIELDKQFNQQTAHGPGY